MKGIVLAGGTGSCLHPLTAVADKHLLPMGNYPMVFHPIARLKQAGTSTVIGMPHWIGDEHEADSATVCQTARDLQAEMNSRAIPLTVLLGNEAFICPDLPDRMQQGDILTLADRSTHLLLELPYEDLPTYVDDSSGPKRDA